MTLLLDTSILIDLENGVERVLAALEKLATQHPAPICISFMTLVEYLFGMQNSTNEKKARAKAFVWKLNTLHTTNETALWLAYLKNTCELRGKPMSLSDLFIASHAVEHNLLLVTRDKSFHDIKEIKTVIL